MHVLIAGKIASLLHIEKPGRNAVERTEKLMEAVMLMQAGFLPINVKFADRRRYYDCFDSFYGENDAAPMVELVAEYVKERLAMYLDVLGA